jgi:hypothetical protein
VVETQGGTKSGHDGTVGANTSGIAKVIARQKSEADHPCGCRPAEGLLRTHTDDHRAVCIHASCLALNSRQTAEAHCSC